MAPPDDRSGRDQQDVIKIRNTLMQATRYAQQTGATVSNADFLWHRDMDVP